MTTKKKKFNRIKIVLLEKERSNMWLASKLGVSEVSVSNWCTNYSQPSLERLFKIAETLDVDVAELLVRGKK